ncbi:MAG: GTP-binding protein, partial [Bacteroidota bacterium]
MAQEIPHEEIPKTIALRPRFQKILDFKKDVILGAFQEQKKNQSQFIITVVDDHIFIKLPKREQHYWSPQLHLEVNDECENSSKLYGLFGPNPTVWTMFMFLHFIVATLFFTVGIWAYSNWTLDKEYAIQVFLTLMTV